VFSQADCQVQEAMKLNPDTKAFVVGLCSMVMTLLFVAGAAMLCGTAALTH